MKQSITEYKFIAEDIAEQDSALETLGLTSYTLEELLAQPKYETVSPVEITGKKAMQVAEVVERVTGFGYDMASAFETLTKQLGTLPTQEEFNVYCLGLVEVFWKKSNPEGIAWSDMVVDAVTNRNYRCYNSQMTELHAILLLKELFPEWTIASGDYLDTLLGVDIIVETSSKRLYLHVFKNSRYSFLAFRKKEKRGGMRDCNGKFHKFRRDFTGDKSLMYEGRADSCSETTKFVNGIPLFQKDWLENQLLIFDKFEQFGEPLADSKKLEYLDQFLETVLTEKEEEIA